MSQEGNSEERPSDVPIRGSVLEHLYPEVYRQSMDIRFHERLMAMKREQLLHRNASVADSLLAAHAGWLAMFRSERDKLLAISPEGRQHLYEKRESSQRETPASRLSTSIFSHPSAEVFEQLLNDDDLFDGFATFLFYTEYIVSQKKSRNKVQHPLSKRHMKALYDNGVKRMLYSDFIIPYCALVKDTLWRSTENAELFLESPNVGSLADFERESLTLRAIDSADFIAQITPALMRRKAHELSPWRMYNYPQERLAGALDRRENEIVLGLSQAITHQRVYGVESSAVSLQRCSMQIGALETALRNTLKHESGIRNTWPRFNSVVGIENRAMYRRLWPKDERWSFDSDKMTALKAYSHDFGHQKKILAHLKSLRAIPDGLLPVGIKVHFRHPPYDNIPGAEIGSFTADNSLATFNFPPLGSASAWREVFQILEERGYPILERDDVNLQVCLPGKLTQEHAAILGLSVLLGSDSARVDWSPSSVHTSQEKSTRARLLLYGAGGLLDRDFPFLARDAEGALELPQLPSYVLRTRELSGERTDILGMSSIRDIEIVRFVGSLLLHAQTRPFDPTERSSAGYWAPHGAAFKEAFMKLVDAHNMHFAFKAPWIFRKNLLNIMLVPESVHERDDKAHFRVLQAVSTIARKNIREAERALAKGEYATGILYDMQDLISRYERIVADEFAQLERAGKISRQQKT